MTVRELMNSDPDAAVEKFTAKVKSLNLTPSAEARLLSMFKSAFLPGSSQHIEIDWNLVESLTDDEMFPYDQLPDPPNPSELLNQLVVLKLNGGLGTTMGCQFPKSLIVCQNGESFFDILVDQLKSFNSEYGTNVPLVLMHSFYTDDQMKPILEKVEGLEVHAFLQNRFPRIYEDTYEPVPDSPTSPNTMWNPPGHADVYQCLQDSGLLDLFLKKGKKYVMISNIDNLGARIDLKVLNKMITDNIPYGCEVTEKTPEEWKGGMPIRYQGHLKLLDTAQVPPAHMEDYIRIHYFHANNLWVNLEMIQSTLSNDTLKTDVIKNLKVFEGRTVVQLEAASGSAIQSFVGAIVLKVPRRRFLPVKTCDELLLMRADLYIKQPNAELLLNPKRTVPGLPAIKLDRCFQKIVDFERRIPNPPSIYNLVSLVVGGDVVFGNGIVLEGTVVICVEPGHNYFVPDGSVLKDVTIKIPEST
jgi:UTP--glucose-1-phosphate uridylyltransferase